MWYKTTPGSQYLRTREGITRTVRKRDLDVLSDPRPIDRTDGNEFATDRPPEGAMSVGLVGALATAGALGVTHAVEPDHVAGIASLTGRYEDSRLSAVVGACFSIGHIALVIGWLAVGYVFLRRTEFPAVFEVAGTLGVAALLIVLGTTLAVRGVRGVLYAHSHEHEHDGETHSHAHAHLPLFGCDNHSLRHYDSQSHEDAIGHNDGDAPAAHDHDHTVGAYLKTGVVGALFTLSPPLSMIAFAATLFPAGPELVVLAVVAYAVAITATMSALGAGVGAAFGRASELNLRVYGGLQALAGALVAGLAVSLLIGSPLVG